MKNKQIHGSYLFLNFHFKNLESELLFNSAMFGINLIDFADLVLIHSGPLR